MAAYDFPDTAGKPTDGSFEYTAPDGTLYEWNGYAWVVPVDKSGGGDSPVETYWDRTDTTLSPTNAGDDVDLGNIQLNADGKITTVGDITSTTKIKTEKDSGAKIAMVGGSTTYGISVTDSGSGTLNGSFNYDGSISLGGTLPSSPNILLNADGTISSTRGFEVNNSGSSTSEPTVKVGHVWGSAALPVAQFGYGVPGSFTSTSEIRRDGSASFSADVIGRKEFVVSATEDTAADILANGGGCALSSNGFIVSASRANPTAPFQAAFRHMQGTTADFLVTEQGTVQIGGTLNVASTQNSTPNITLNAGGEIYTKKYGGIFMNDVDKYDYGIFMTANAANTTNYLAFNAGRLNNKAAARMVIDGTTGNFGIGGVLPASPNITLNADGLVTASKYNAYTGINCFYDSGKIKHDHPDFFVVQGTDIGVYLSSGQTAWQPTTSERRLKENIVAIDVDTAWETIKSTPYYSYNFIGVEATNYGPMADEVPAEMVVQPMVDDEDGNKVARADAEGPIRTYDNGMLQARLYTALQTALTRIEALEAEVTSLKGTLTTDI